MRMFGLLAAIMAVTTAAAAQDAAAKRELTPTGKLRAAIAHGPAPSALYVLQDAPGKFRGVSIDLSNEMAKKLGVPVEFVPYLASGEIQAAADKGVWDISFMPVDEERKKFVDFGNAYHLLQSTYLVAPGSMVKSVADANAPSVHICGVKDTATFRANKRVSPNATQVELSGPDEMIAMMMSGKCEVIALSRESLAGIVVKIPGPRILDDAFLNPTPAIAVPKNKPAALAYATAFIEEAKASGLLRRSLDAMGLQIAMVAPA